MLRLIRHPALWLSALLGWFGVLWALSAFPIANGGIEIPHLDKVLHFGYFFCGGVIFTAWRFCCKPEFPAWGRVVLSAVVTMAFIGLLDEWHQYYTPGRSGLDLGDWLADVIGGTAGACVLRIIHRRFL